jgi:hypothetical protein
MLDDGSGHERSWSKAAQIPTPNFERNLHDFDARWQRHIGSRPKRIPI